MNRTTVKHNWKISEVDSKQSRILAKAIGVPHIVGHLLILRGIATPEEAKRYLSPTLQHLSDPFLLTDMRIAVERIAQARERQEHVLVFGDYDVDGVAATAILLNALHQFGITHVSHGMPSRICEGYGLNNGRVEAAHRDGISLIITVDNGISAHTPAKCAAKLGIDLLITDHHTPDGGLPQACAVVNPKREEPDHPSAHLCGAGVAFKLAWALNGVPHDLDIAALATVADIVPLQGENRAIVALGLRHMVKHERLGLAKLAKTAGFQLRDVSSHRIGFQMAPRINAAGRLDDATTALRLLLSECSDEASTLAKVLNDTNEQRRLIQREIYEDAIKELDTFVAPQMKSLVLARNGWHAGVIGIVGSRIQEQYRRPTVLIAINEDGLGHASGRSGPGFDLVGALAACQEHLVKFGGHRAAAGFTIREDSIPAFRIDFEAEARRQLGDDEVIPELKIDLLTAFSQIDVTFLDLLDRFQPIGNKNPAPILCTLGVETVEQSVCVLNDAHLKMSVRQGGVVFPAIGFGMAEHYCIKNLSGPIDIAYSPEFNTWRGETTIQLLLKDIRA